MTRKQEFNRRTLLAAALGVSVLPSCKLIGPSCEASTVNGVDWIPDATRPVSWGIDYVGPPTGAPLPMMIAYPSAVRPEDASTSRAMRTATTDANLAPHDLTRGDAVADPRPILRHCLTRWPVVLLLHGGDRVLPIKGLHLYWRTMASALARSGCVVIVPNWRTTDITSPSPIDNSVEGAAARAWQYIEWVRTEWRYAWWVDSRPEETLFVGHSLGGQVALTLGVERPECAGVVSLGGYQLLNPAMPWLNRVWAELRAPVLFMRTNARYEQVPAARWQALPGDKYELTYAGGHFDYLDQLPYVQRERFFDDDPMYRPGGCSAFTYFAAHLVSLFAARYLRAETVPPPSLETPVVTLTPAQRRFTEGYVDTTVGLGTSPGCEDIRLRWVVNSQAGTRSLA